MQNIIINNVSTTTFTPFTTTTALDFAYDELRAGRIAPALDELFDDLEGRRLEEPAEWADYARGTLDHPLRALLHQDPFTYRAFSKPRGYAGDAVMMDYIYGLGEAIPAAREATPLGRAIFQYMDSRPSAKAVRYRRRLLAGLIDRVAKRGNASVLAIAAGHLREVELSQAVQIGRLREFVALDQDENSLALVDREYSRLGIRTQPGSVRQILAGKAALGAVRLRLCCRPVRLSERSRRRGADAPHVRYGASRRPDAHSELPDRRRGPGLHGKLHGLASDLSGRNGDAVARFRASAERSGGLPGLRRRCGHRHLPARIEGDVDRAARRTDHASLANSGQHPVQFPATAVAFAFTRKRIPSGAAYDDCWPDRVSTCPDT